MDDDDYEEGDTPLHTACRKRDSELANKLILGGANLHEVNINKETPLHIACENGNLETVKMLLSHGADLNVLTVSNETPLYLACMVDFDDSTMYHNGEPTMYGNRNYIGIVKEILNTPTGMLSINTPNIHGETPLHLACDDMYLDIIKEFLDKGANLNVTDSKGETPLHRICYNVETSSRYYKIVIDLLLEKGADPNIIANNGWNALFAFIKSIINDDCCILHDYYDGDIPKICQNLITYGADPNIVDDKGHTMLHECALNGYCKSDYEQLTEELLIGGADPDITDNRNKTPLFYATSSFGSREVEIKLLKGGATPCAGVAKFNYFPPLKILCLRLVRKCKIDITKIPRALFLDT